MGYCLGYRIARSRLRASPQLPDNGSLPQGDALTRLLEMYLPWPLFDVGVCV